ncbi:glycosyl transferase [Opitutaceae bacterium EW11]|nr:glycosyl transferase [Opitutaceae bacterium EW11]
MSHAPTISICMPAYRAEKYLPPALESVRRQTFSNWELIVTEDGSRDATESLVRAFAASVPQNVVYNRHEQNQGLPATRNTGIAAARGEWVAFLDADDLWEPEHLQRLLDASVGTDWVFAGCQVFDDATGNDLDLRVPPSDSGPFPVALFTGRLIIQPSCTMVRRTSLAVAGGFSSEYPICNDMEYWCRLASRGIQARYSGAITCRYRKHPGAMSRKAAALIAESARVCETYAAWDAIPPDVRRRHPAALYLYAGQILLRENPLLAREYFRRCLALGGFSPKAGAYFLATLLPGGRSATV